MPISAVSTAGHFAGSMPFILRFTRGIQPGSSKKRLPARWTGFGPSFTGDSMVPEAACARAKAIGRVWIRDAVPGASLTAVAVGGLPVAVMMCRKLSVTISLVPCVAVTSAQAVLKAGRMSMDGGFSLVALHCASALDYKKEPRMNIFDGP
ncbi:hypothetical protein AQ611_22105 [Burkholderia singularis]|nr:hypothetical protein AQ611_22105 [Burkholderia sp. Bp7605]